MRNCQIYTINVRTDLHNRNAKLWAMYCSDIIKWERKIKHVNYHIIEGKPSIAYKKHIYYQIPEVKKRRKENALKRKQNKIPPTRTACPN